MKMYPLWRRKKVIFQQIILFFWPVPISTDKTKPPKSPRWWFPQYVLYNVQPGIFGETFPFLTSSRHIFSTQARVGGEKPINGQMNSRWSAGIGQHRSLRREFGSGAGCRAAGGRCLVPWGGILRLAGFVVRVFFDFMVHHRFGSIGMIPFIIPRYPWTPTTHGKMKGFTPPPNMGLL